MCGIFGMFGGDVIEPSVFRGLAKLSERRGSDSSGLAFLRGDAVHIVRMNDSITKLLKIEPLASDVKWAVGHSRLITDGNADNQPVEYDEMLLIHNGIITNVTELWETFGTLERRQEIDSEIIAAIARHEKSTIGSMHGLGALFDEKLQGSASICLIDQRDGEMILYSNTGSLYLGQSNDNYAFASERQMLEIQRFSGVRQVTFTHIRERLECGSELKERLFATVGDRPVVAPLLLDGRDAALLKYPTFVARRCTKCILPETMPFIEFDSSGVCNYCLNAKPMKTEPDVTGLMKEIDIYRGKGAYDCIVPFSGGRDSTFLLDYVVNTLGLRPVTMTYDWGMVTDLGRRNISRVISKLKVENIIIAANIRRKREYIRKNLAAWLHSPDLGMLNILMAGDKHFFKYIEDIKNEHKTALNIWGMNPLETTHFKAGFLGVRPYFSSKQVFNTGLVSQLDYHSKRLIRMCKNPRYFNSSLYDTYSGEYYRSIQKKVGLINLFDYLPWDEEDVHKAIEKYDWEYALDTSTTWRIGDGTAGFYNYVYYLFAGFTENDTFRSNQIRQGTLSRDEALRLINLENEPRYSNIKWYLDLLGFDYSQTIKRINDAADQYHRAHNIRVDTVR